MAQLVFRVPPIIQSVLLYIYNVQDRLESEKEQSTVNLV